MFLSSSQETVFVKMVSFETALQRNDSRLGPQPGYARTVLASFHPATSHSEACQPYFGTSVGRRSLQVA